MSASPFPTQFQNILPTAHDNVLTRLSKLELRLGDSANPVLSFNGRAGAVALELSDITGVADSHYVQLSGFNSLGDSRYVLKTGDTMSGNLTVNGILTVRDFVEMGGFFVHEQSITVNGAPVAGDFYHESTAGTPVVGNGISVDYTMDSATVKRQIGARWITSWTVATDATRTSQVRLFLPNAGVFSLALTVSVTTLGFYGVAPVTRPSVPDGSTLATVIDALQSLGLFNPV